MSGFKAIKTDDTDSFFRAFKADSGVTVGDYAVAAFGDTPEMADELLKLTLSGVKRATASLARDYGEGKEAMPAVGDYVVLVDGRNKPRAVWRTTEIEIKPLKAVTAEFAEVEGEGDGTRDWWLNAHRDEFRRQAEREGFAFTDDIDTVFEQFTIVWPRLFADGPLVMPTLN